MKLNLGMDPADFFVSLASVAMRVPASELRPLRPATVVELFRRRALS